MTEAFDWHTCPPVPGWHVAWFLHGLSLQVWVTCKGGEFNKYLQSKQSWVIWFLTHDSKTFSYKLQHNLLGTDLIHCLWGICTYKCTLIPCPSLYWLCTCVYCLHSQHKWQTDQVPGTCQLTLVRHIQWHSQCYKLGSSNCLNHEYKYIGLEFWL